MMALFTSLVTSGHLYLIVGIAATQVYAFKEVACLVNQGQSPLIARSSRALSWYLFIVAMYYCHGEALCYYFSHVVSKGSILTNLAIGYHRFLILLLYLLSYVYLIGTARLEHIKGQLKQFVSTHFAVFWIVAPGYYAIQATLEGLIWFLLPAALVVMNDIFAYVCGRSFGRTSLLRVSPKKTVEGFVGAWIITMISSIAIAYGLQQHTFFTCKANNLGASIWTGLSYTKSLPFVPQAYEIPFIANPLNIAPVYAHALVLATFASLLAPFGGFFASAVKRSMHVKDFGAIIPGHGGVVDRIDCQLFMMLIACMYYHAFVFLAASSSVLMRYSTGGDAKIDMVIGMVHELVRSGVPLEAIVQRMGSIGQA